MTSLLSIATLHFSKVFLRKIYNCTIPPAFPPSPSLPSPSPLSSPSPPSPFSGGSGVSPSEKILGIRDARRWVLEHFGDKNQHRYERFLNDARDLCLILTMFSGCCVWIPHYNGAMTGCMQGSFPAGTPGNGVPSYFDSGNGVPRNAKLALGELYKKHKICTKIRLFEIPNRIFFAPQYGGEHPSPHPTPLATSALELACPPIC